MSVIKRVKPNEVFMGRLPHGCDLLDELTKICEEKDVSTGRIETLGAVQKARVAYYNQRTREYEFHTIEKPLEITQLTGNVSLKDGKPFVHAHITLADDTGRTYGGHLAPGTVVFACEVVLESFEGAVFEREFDDETGLPLWGGSGR